MAPDPPHLALKIARIRAGFSQKELADLAGVSMQTVSLAERGVTPGEETRAKIVEPLGLESKDIWPMEREAA